MWNGNDEHMDDGWGLAMMLGMLGFWVLLTAAIGFAIVWAIRSARTPTVPPIAPTMVAATGPADGRVTASAEQILAERLARGEIDTEEYKARLAALATRSVS
jgi:putative membrane protein